jgi:hypothetical protein
MRAVGAREGRQVREGFECERQTVTRKDEGGKTNFFPVEELFDFSFSDTFQ